MLNLRTFENVRINLSEQIISTGAMLVASGSWFAEKIFGPSINALGENLRAHLQSRIPIIFGRAESIAKTANLELAPIRPGLLTRMIVDASFSDDLPEITEWWANLFVEAATKETEANMHAVFSDIMAMIGPQEVKVLSDFVSFYRLQVAYLTPDMRKNVETVGSVVQETLLFSVVDKFPLNANSAQEVDEHFTNPKIPLPVRTFGWKVPSSAGEALSWRVHTLDWYKTNPVSIEILERSRVLKFIRLEIPILADQAAWVDLVGITALGREFYEACSRQPLAGNQ